MGNKYHFSGKTIDKMNEFIDNTIEQGKDTPLQRYDLLKPLYDKFIEAENLSNNGYDIKLDLEQIAANFLIENIEASFNAWESTPWKEQVSFETFCQHILPYKINNSSFDNAKIKIPKTFKTMRDSAFKYKNMNDALEFIKDSLEKRFIVNSPFDMNKVPFDRTFTNYDKLLVGDCTDYTYYTTTIARSFGVPATIDYVPQWGNTIGKHHWVSPIKLSNALLSNVNDTITVKNLIEPKTMNFIVKRFDKIEDYDLVHKRTTPKVYRTSNEPNKRLTKLMLKYPNEIHNSFLENYFEDITNKYVQTANVEIAIQKVHKKANVIYLCVFNTRGWNPVDFACNNRGIAKFENIGVNILYLPMCIKDNKLVPVNKPFILKPDGTQHIIAPIKDVRERVKLTRKWPQFYRNVFNAMPFYRTTFLGSNTIDFSQKDTLHYIDSVPVKPESFHIKPNKRYKYIKCAVPFGRVCFSELQFIYVDEDGNENILPRDKYKIVDNDSSKFTKAFDGDYGTFMNLNKCLSFTLEFPDTKIKIVKVRYCPRSDTNFILPRDTYELLYWDNKWISLGEKVAVDYHLNYESPKGALLWLKNKTRGKEERAFTYECSKQVFW